MRRAPGRRSLPLLASTLLLGLATLPAVARAEEPPPDAPSSRVALDFGGTLGAMRHPAAALPPSPVGNLRSTPDRNTVPRLSFGVHLALSQFFHVRNLWESNVLDWYLSGDLRVFSLRVGLEKELPLSRHLALGLAAHGAAAEASMGTGELSFEAPDDPERPEPDRIGELRANQWLFGLGGTVSLLILTGSPIYFRVQASYTQYLEKARHFAFRGKDFTPEGFSVSLSGPAGGVSVGFRL